MMSKNELSELVQSAGVAIRERYYQRGLWVPEQTSDGYEAQVLGDYRRIRVLNAGDINHRASLRHAYMVRTDETPVKPMSFSLILTPSIVRSDFRWHLLGEVRTRLEKDYGLRQQTMSRTERSTLEKVLGAWSHRAANGLFGDARRVAFILSGLLKRFLDPQVRAWAFQVGGYEAGATAYSLLFAHRPQVERVMQEAPNLLPLWYALNERDMDVAGRSVVQQSDPLQLVSDMKLRMREAGLTNAGWRYLSRLPSNWVRSFVRRGNVEYGLDEASETMNRLARVGENLRYTAFMFVISSEALGSRMAQKSRAISPLDAFNLQNEAIDHEAESETRLAFVRALARECQRRKRGVKALVREEAALALDWLRHERVTLDTNQRRASWANWMARQEEWHERVAAQTAFNGKPRRWHSLVSEFEQGGFTVVPLTDSVQLHEEGRRMHHCVSTYANRCADGDSRVFSLRRGTSRVATLELARESKGKSVSWRINQVRGHCNSAVSASVTKLAQEVLARYRAAWKSGQRHADSEDLVIKAAEAA